jgi:hypothetical protein
MLLSAYTFTVSTASWICEPKLELRQHVAFAGLVPASYRHGVFPCESLGAAMFELPALRLRPARVRRLLYRRSSRRVLNTCRHWMAESAQDVTLVSRGRGYLCCGLVTKRMAYLLAGQHWQASGTQFPPTVPPRRGKLTMSRDGHEEAPGDACARTIHFILGGGETSCPVELFNSSRPSFLRVF